MGTKKKVDSPAVPAPAQEPNPPEAILAGLGLVGLEAVEPVVLASLISEAPLLLIGPHGVGKSHLLIRLAEALGLPYRHYNASLLSFDDLIGFPIPDEKGGLRYVTTPASVWGAEAVFLDEISRCRPEVQNKLFSLIHERRVQGIAIEGLKFRWSAMNPPPREDGETIYGGAEPLDAALADRFAFVVEIPDWQDLPADGQERLIRSGRRQADGRAAGALRRLLEEGRRLAAELETHHAPALAVYVRLVCGGLRQANLTLSPRRAVTLLQNIAAVHAVRVLLYPGAEWERSAMLALRHSIPQRATQATVSDLALLTAHKEAWRISRMDGDSPLQFLLTERDPARRAALAVRLPGLSREEFSSVIADSLAALPAGGREALAANLFEEGHAGRLAAAVAQQCAESYATVAAPQNLHEMVQTGGVRHRVWQAVVSRLAGLPDGDGESLLIRNLLVGLFGGNAVRVEADIDAILTQWTTTRAVLRGRGAA